MIEFNDMLESRSRQLETLLCVGLDTKVSKMPRSFKEQMIECYTHGRSVDYELSPKGDTEIDSYILSIPDLLQMTVFIFNKYILRAVKDVALCVKANLGFYLNARALPALDSTLRYAKGLGIPVILDGKFGDVAGSSDEYAGFAFN